MTFGQRLTVMPRFDHGAPKRRLIALFDLDRLRKLGTNDRFPNLSSTSSALGALSFAKYA